MRTLAIGDVHGCFDALESLLDFINLTEDDTLITLGDYTDRGPDSQKVLDLLIELQQSHNLIALRGNHESMMENARNSTQELYFWLANGGEATLMSFGESDLTQIPERYWQFFQSLELYHETDTHIFVHAGLAAARPMHEQDTEDLLWRRFNLSDPHMSGKTMVCGHTTQPGKPSVREAAICIDTRACAGDWLTCLDADSGEYWQANQKRETRRGRIE